MSELPDPRGYYIGTSGWSYDIWKPDFFPADLAKTKFLRYYATRLTACEVNYTFRNRLAASTAQKWISETPPSFRFTCKANQFITHMRRLKNCEEPIQTFADGMAPLFEAKRLGAVLFQLPPNLQADTTLLTDFLALLPRWMRAAFEFRHESWFNDKTYTALRNAKAALCLAETDDLTTPDIHTAPFAYYRFRKPDYPPAARQEIAARIRQAREQAGEVYVFFKHEERPDSPLNAVDLLNLLVK